MQVYVRTSLFPVSLRRVGAEIPRKDSEKVSLTHSLNLNRHLSFLGHPEKFKHSTMQMLDWFIQMNKNRREMPLSYFEAQLITYDLWKDTVSLKNVVGLKQTKKPPTPWQVLSGTCPGVLSCTPHTKCHCKMTFSSLFSLSSVADAAHPKQAGKVPKTPIPQTLTQEWSHRA